MDGAPLSSIDQTRKAAMEALTDLHQTFTHENPASRRIHEKSCEYLPGGNTRTVLHTLPFPLTFHKGYGQRLVSVDGHTYTDFLSEFTAGIFGHNNSTIRAAIDKALDGGWSFGGINAYEQELAHAVCDRFSPTMELVRFTNSGTEANMMAVAAAVAWTGRKKILVFEKGYHGATLSFRTAPAHGEKNVNMPHEWVFGSYNDIDKTKTALSAIPSHSLAAILVEPMLGSGGAIPGDQSFLRFLRSYASTARALLIFDEVMTSRLSYRGLGHKLNIRPDLMTLGKWVGGGMSFGAFGGRRDIMAMFDPRSGSLGHAGTFNNNIISMAAGCAGCKVLDEETTNKINALGEEMKLIVNHVILGYLKSEEMEQSDNSNSTMNGHATHGKSPAMWVSGMGSILAIHFAPSPSQSTLQSLFYHHMLTEGIYLAERGFIALNVELQLKDLQSFTEAVETFLYKYGSFLVHTDQE